MSKAPVGPGANGADSIEAIRAAAFARAASAPVSVPPSPVELAPAKGQATRYPYLQAFSARAQFPPAPRIQIARGAKEQPKPVAYEVHLGICCAADLGRQLTMTLTPGMQARELAVLLRAAGDAVDKMADQVDQDNPAAAEGPRLALVAPAGDVGAGPHAADRACGCAACRQAVAEADAGGPVASGLSTGATDAGTKPPKA